MQGGVAAPPDPLIWGEPAGALALEEEDALVEGVRVVVAGRRCADRKEDD